MPISKGTKLWASTQTALCISSLLEQVPSLRSVVLQDELEFSRTRRAGEGQEGGDSWRQSSGI